MPHRFSKPTQELDLKRFEQTLKPTLDAEVYRVQRPLLCPEAFSQRKVIFLLSQQPTPVSIREFRQVDSPAHLPKRSCARAGATSHTAVCQCSRKKHKKEEKTEKIRKFRSNGQIPGQNGTKFSEYGGPHGPSPLQTG